jgi:hypothetical protein
MRVPVAVVTGAVTVCRASGPGDLMVVSVRGAFPYCLIVVFVHVQARGDPGTDTYDFGIGKQPTNLPRCGRSATPPTGARSASNESATTQVITLVRNRPGVARGQRRIGRGSKTRPT